MPFTVSHIAAILPLTRRPFIVSALVIGAMSPDFEKFLKLSNKADFAHSIPGMFVFCLPAGLVVFLLFHCCFKNPLLSLLPMTVQERMPLPNDMGVSSMRNVALVLMSLLVGAASHVAWDSFTHPTGWFVERISFLQSTILQTRHGSLRVYKVLQYASTVVGAVLIFVWLLRWFRNSPRKTVPAELILAARTKMFLLAAMFGIACVAASAYALSKESAWSNFRSVRFFVGHAAIAGMAMIFVELLMFSAAWHLMIRRRTRPAAL